jgi:outer membrane protein assembly factor BamD (BamD/ComL family)
MMSVASIFSSGIFNSLTQNAQSTSKASGSSFQQEFQQLGKDLQSGSLSAAQSDFSTLQQAPTSQSTNTVGQQLSQLSQDLQSGNLAAAQQDDATLQQALQSNGTQGHHHSHRGGGGALASDSSALPTTSTASAATGSSSNSLFQQMSQALQAGNISAAQQAYSNLGAQLFTS